MKIFLDAGHGGKDPGALGAYSKEKDITLLLTLKIGEKLKQHGIDVVFTRIDDTYIDYTKVGGVANTAKADYFISIHCNSNPNKTAKGTETYAYKTGGQGERLANCIQSELINIEGIVNRGVKYADFAVLRMTDMPAVLVETMFISNTEEENRLNDPVWQDKLFNAIANGMLNFLGIAVKSAEEKYPSLEEAIIILGDKITNPDMWKQKANPAKVSQVRKRPGC